MSAAGFWDNQEAAQEVVSQLKGLKLVLSPLEEAISSAEDLDALGRLFQRPFAIHLQVECDQRKGL